jgi:hypothetical protein
MEHFSVMVGVVQMEVVGGQEGPFSSLQKLLSSLSVDLLKLMEVMDIKTTA